MNDTGKGQAQRVIQAWPSREMYEAEKAAFETAAKRYQEQCQLAERETDFAAFNFGWHAHHEAYAASLPQKPKLGKWGTMMATVLPCGHTNAQHFYAESGDLKLAPCTLEANALQGKAAPDERAEFEKWARILGNTDFSREPKAPGIYADALCQCSWDGWQARAALAEGARKENL